jgi:hypothetical protein
VFCTHEEDVTEAKATRPALRSTAIPVGLTDRGRSHTVGCQSVASFLEWERAIGANVLTESAWENGD